MSAIELSPKGNEYLRPDIEYQQLTDNKKDITLPSNMDVGYVNPKVCLDGCGRAELEGQIKINTSSLTTNMIIGSMPLNIQPQHDQFFPVVTLRSGAPVLNHVQITGLEGSIGSVTGVNITNAGDYNGTIPTITTGGAGTGATFQVHVEGNSVFTIPSIGSGGYAPGDTLTMTGGTFSAPLIVTISTTRLFSATINAAGSGGVNGPVVLTGTGGTGTKYTINGTISGGALTALGSIILDGSYTVNPTVSADPVTGGSLSGASLTLKMVPNTYVISQAGDYTVVPSNPASATTSGSGTGFTYSLFWQVSAVDVLTPGVAYDNTSTITFSAGTITAEGSLVIGTETSGDIVLLEEPQQNDVVCLDKCYFLTNSY